jgi:hypothetical protein
MADRHFDAGMSAWQVCVLDNVMHYIDPESNTNHAWRQHFYLPI